MSNRALLILYVAAALAFAWFGAIFTSGPSHARNSRLERCMVYLPAMRDAKLRRWCLKQSERMP